MTRIAVCELESAAAGLDEQWRALGDRARRERPELLLLPEMGLAPWLAVGARPDHDAWVRGEQLHRERIAAFGELEVPVVAGTLPVVEDGRRYNEAFVWSAGAGYRAVHRKTYLPDEPGFQEASWYERGPTRFDPVDTEVGRIAFLVCTELWFLDRAREYGKAGVELLLCPRATPAASLDKWLAAGRVAATVSGAFCLSSNHAGSQPGVTMAGCGWVCGPEEGELLATTSAESPFVALDVDLDDARSAKRTYPRSVDDS